MAFDDKEVKWIRDEEAVRMRVRREAAESGNFIMPVQVENVSIKIVGFDMPFWSIVWLMIKITIAAIPAAIVVFIVVALFQLFFAGVLAAFVGAFSR